MSLRDLRDHFFSATLAVLSGLLRAGDVVLDIGANIGLMTLHAARLVARTGEVFSFEPMPDLYTA